MARILVIHGPNLNLLGSRDPEVYGSATLDEIDLRLRDRARACGAECVTAQSNVEGEIVNLIHDAKGRFDALVINPGGYSHTSVAIRDAIEAVALPTIEVHLSNIYAREPFRHTSITAAKCIGVISGFGPRSYELGLDAALSFVEGYRSP